MPDLGDMQGRMRMVRFSSPGGPLVGRLLNGQELQRCKVARQGQEYSMETVVVTDGPYCENFRTVCQYHMMADDDLHISGCRLAIKFSLVYVRRVNYMLRAVIANAAEKGLHHHFSKYMRILSTFAPIWDLNCPKAAAAATAARCAGPMPLAGRAGAASAAEQPSIAAGGAEERLADGATGAAPRSRKPHGLHSRRLRSAAAAGAASAPMAGHGEARGSSSDSGTAGRRPLRPMRMSSGGGLYEAMSGSGGDLQWEYHTDWTQCSWWVQFRNGPLTDAMVLVAAWFHRAILARWDAPRSAPASLDGEQSEQQRDTPSSARSPLPLEPYYDNSAYRLVGLLLSQLVLFVLISCAVFTLQQGHRICGVVLPETLQASCRRLWLQLPLPQSLPQVLASVMLLSASQRILAAGGKVVNEARSMVWQPVSPGCCAPGGSSRSASQISRHSLHAPLSTDAQSDTSSSAPSGVGVPSSSLGDASADGCEPRTAADAGTAGLRRGAVPGRTPAAAREEGTLLPGVRLARWLGYLHPRSIVAALGRGPRAPDGGAAAAAGAGAEGAAASSAAQELAESRMFGSVHVIEGYIPPLQPEEYEGSATRSPPACEADDAVAAASSPFPAEDAWETAAAAGAASSGSTDAPGSASRGATRMSRASSCSPALMSGDAGSSQAATRALSAAQHRSRSMAAGLADGHSDMEAAAQAGEEAGEGSEEDGEEEGDLVREVVFENERKQPFRGWGHHWPGHFLPTDPVGHWSGKGTKHSGRDCADFHRVAPQLRSGWQWLESEWQLDLAGSEAGCVDAAGWSYALDFNRLQYPPLPGSGRDSIGAFVRRRAWLRQRSRCGCADSAAAATAGVGSSSVEGAAVDHQHDDAAPGTEAVANRQRRAADAQDSMLEEATESVAAVPLEAAELSEAPAAGEAADSDCAQRSPAQTCDTRGPQPSLRSLSEVRNGGTSSEPPEAHGSAGALGAALDGWVGADRTVAPDEGGRLGPCMLKHPEASDAQINAAAQADPLAAASGSAPLPAAASHGGCAAEAGCIPELQALSSRAASLSTGTEDGLEPGRAAAGCQAAAASAEGPGRGRDETQSADHERSDPAAATPAAATNGQAERVAGTRALESVSERPEGGVRAVGKDRQPRPTPDSAADLLRSWSLMWASPNHSSPSRAPRSSSTPRTVPPAAASSPELRASAARSPPPCSTIRRAPSSFAADVPAEHLLSPASSSPCPPAEGSPAPAGSSGHLSPSRPSAAVAAARARPRTWNQKQRLSRRWRDDELPMTSAPSPSASRQEERAPAGSPAAPEPAAPPDRLTSSPAACSPVSPAGTALTASEIAAAAAGPRHPDGSEPSAQRQWKPSLSSAAASAAEGSALLAGRDGADIGSIARMAEAGCDASAEELLRGLRARAGRPAGGTARGGGRCLRNAASLPCSGSSRRRRFRANSSRSRSCPPGREGGARTLGHASSSSKKGEDGCVTPASNLQRLPVADHAGSAASASARREVVSDTEAELAEEGRMQTGSEHASADASVGIGARASRPYALASAEERMRWALFRKYSEAFYGATSRPSQGTHTSSSSISQPVGSRQPGTAAVWGSCACRGV